MRYNALILAVGLFIIDAALASPCKPRATTSAAVTFQSETTISEPTNTNLATTTDVSTDSSTDVTESTIFEPATTTSLAGDTTTVTFNSETPTASDFETITTTHSDVEITTTTTSDIEITTSAASDVETTTTPTESDIETSTTLDVESTTSAVVTTTSSIETTTASPVETSTTAPAPIPTFSITASGNSINGSPLTSNGAEKSLLVFNPRIVGFNTRSYILDSGNGRLREFATGLYICAAYGSSITPDTPAVLTNCPSSGAGPNTQFDYLSCELVGGKLSCTAPKASCVRSICATALGNAVHSQFFYQTRVFSGDVALIGSGTPSGYDPVQFNAVFS